MKEESLVKTFRLDYSIISGLEQEAKKQGATLSGLVCRILRKYVTIEARINEFGIISFLKEDFIKIIEEIPDEKIAEIGKKIGKSVSRDILLTLFGEISLNTFRQFLTMFICGYANWINLYEIESEDKIEFRITHNLGKKWNIFIKNYIDTLLETIINLKPEKIISTDQSLVFYIKKSL
ncbi:MAG: hypothetical protein QXW62_05385 [Candidatus Methanomethylicaceae archaeon]|nr:hypothetical protein [Candidatus Verstraetearchaeota archaeon]